VDQIASGTATTDGFYLRRQDANNWYGRARQMVVVALGKMKKNAASVMDVLIELLVDEDVAGHAVIALGKLKDQRAREAVAALQNHPKAWVRAEVKKALARMER
jgi:HEAT repeat protein